MEKRASQLLKEDRLSLLIPQIYKSTDAYDIPNHPLTTKHYKPKGKSIHCHTNQKNSPMAIHRPKNINEGLRHMLDSDLLKKQTLTTRYNITRTAEASYSPKKYDAFSNIQKEAEIDKISKLSSTKNSSNNISQAKKESQNGSNYWGSDSLQSKDILPLSNHAERESLDDRDPKQKRKHSKAQISMDSNALPFYAPYGFLQKIEETMKTGSKIKISLKRPPAISMSCANNPPNSLKEQLDNLKYKMKQLLEQFKGRERNLIGIVESLRLQLKVANERLKTFEEHC